MREKRSLMIFFVSLVMFMGSMSMMGIIPLLAAEPMQSDTPPPQAADVGYLENITLESPMPGKERVVVSVSRLSGAMVESQTKNTLVVKLDNTFVPQDFRRPIGEGALRNIARVVPAQKILEGRQWAYLTIELKERVPHSVRQEGQNVIIDFNVASIAAKATASLPQSSAAEAASPLNGSKVKATVSKPDQGGETASDAKNYGGRKISLDFQDANIKSVLRLLSELAEVNIVSGDDVKGNLTLQMKNVPWDQALDTILAITGLARKQEANVITIMTLEKMKKDEADRQAALDARRKVELEQMAKPVEPFVTRVVGINYTDAPKLTANIVDLLPKDKDGKVQGSVKVDEHSNSLIIQATRQDMTRLLPIIEKIDKPIPQILIKANIVETTKDTARNLGIQWGGMYGQKIGSQGLYVTPGGVSGSNVSPTNPFAGADTSKGGYTPTSNIGGLAGQGFGVNFPAAMSTSASASLGLIFGTIGENILEVQLNALQKDGKLNILSSPSITTLDNQKAFTENGQKVPYVTSEASGGLLVKTVKFESAVLRLEITPHVIDGKNMKMKILVQKDEVDPSRNVDGNPFITKKQTETNLIVGDGETIVISGLTKQTNTENVNGVPWLKDVPLLGWLFKGENKNDTMEEVLIFITPSIVKTETIAGIQEGA